MARLLRLHPHALRRSHLLSSPSLAAFREIQVPTHPESKKDARRWFGENAVLEEICSAAQSNKDLLGLDKAANQDRLKNKVVSGETERESKVASPSVSGEQKSSVQRDTDKLTNFIIGSFKGTQNAENKTKSFVSKKHTSSKISTPVGGSEKFGDQKVQWQKVINSIRESTAKLRPCIPSPSRDQPRSSEEPSSDTEDDFADLDLPQGNDNKAGVSRTSNSSNRHSLVTDTFDKRPIFESNSRQIENHFQGLNQQKPKETKTIGSVFLKSSHTKGVPAGAQTSDTSFVKTEETVSKPLSNEAPVLRVPDSGYTVCVQNLPASCNIALIKDALSVHGEVTGSFKKFTPNGSCACYIEYKTDEAKEEALAVRWIQLDSKSFPIVRVERPLSTVVRVCRVSMKTNENEILSQCRERGSIDSIKRRGHGAFDVYYKVTELPNILKILDSLNEVVLHSSRWIALPAPVLHPAIKKDFLKSREAQAWHLSQMNRMLDRIEAGLENVNVYFEDLKVLGSMEKDFERSLGK